MVTGGDRAPARLSLGRHPGLGMACPAFGGGADTELPQTAVFPGLKQNEQTQHSLEDPGGHPPPSSLVCSPILKVDSAFEL